MLKGDGKVFCVEARVETTNHCNASCTICPRETMTRPKALMDTGLYLRVMDQLKELGVSKVSLFGFGEPLMDKGLEGRIRYARCLGMETYITTNASLLDAKRTYALLDAHLNHIRFSVHGVKEETYEAVHQRLRWDRVVSNISGFITTNNMEGHRTTTHVSVIPMNGETVEEIVEFWADMGVDYIEVWKPHGWGGAKQFRDPPPDGQTCYRPFSGPIQVQADGKLIPCCFLTNGEIILGDATTEPIADILTGSALQALQECHTVGQYGDLPCKKCDQRR